MLFIVGRGAMFDRVTRCYACGREWSPTPSPYNCVVCKNLVPGVRYWSEPWLPELGVLLDNYRQLRDAGDSLHPLQQCPFERAKKIAMVTTSAPFGNDQSLVKRFETAVGFDAVNIPDTLRVGCSKPSTFDDATQPALFTREALMEETGITYHQSRYWVAKGMLRPFENRGGRPVFTRGAVTHAGAVKNLLGFASGVRIRRSFEFLSKRTHLLEMLEGCETSVEALRVYDHVSQWCERDDTGIYDRDLFRSVVTQTISSYDRATRGASTTTDRLD